MARHDGGFVRLSDAGLKRIASAPICEQQIGQMRAYDRALNDI
jgi:hypothetical protein